MKKGFTLIELIVSIGILGLVVAAAVNMFFSTMKSSKKTDNLLALRQNGDYVLNTIKSRVYNADTISCLGGNHLVVDEMVLDEEGRELRVDFIFFPYSGTLEMDDKDLVDSGRFKVSGGSFVCLPNPNTLTQVKMGFTLEMKDGSGESQSFQSDIFLRDC